MHMYPPVSLDAYQGSGLSGFGSSYQNQVDSLNKALSAGYTNPIDGTQGGSALRVESLESSLKVLTYTERHLRLWPMLYKTAAYSTVEEFNQLNAYGDDDYMPFFNEGQLPTANDSTYTRKTALIKFLGTTRSVTHPATMVNPAHGDLIALENANGILWLLRQIEFFLFHGDADLTFSGEGLQWNGLDKLIDSNSVIDMESAPFQEADFEEAATILAADAYAYPTDVFLGFRPMSDLVKIQYPRQRIMPPGGNTRIGQAVTEVNTQAGPVQFQPNIFLKRPKVASSTARGPSAMVPTAPASITPTTTAATTGQFDKSQGSSDAIYYYKVSAANQYGESAATSAAVVSATITGANAEAGYKVSYTVANAGAITNPPEWFNVYRTAALEPGASAPASDSAYSLIAQKPATSQAAAGTGLSATDDLNVTMPFTEVAYMGEVTPQVVTFRQLAPLMKMDLAILAPAYRWMILLYGALLLYAPKKFLRFTNIGRLGS